MGEEPPACELKGQIPGPLSDDATLRASLEALCTLKEGDKLWIAPDGLASAQAASFSASLQRSWYGQGRTKTVEWALGCNTKVRKLVEEAIVAAESGRGGVVTFPSLAQTLDSAANGMERLRCTYTGDMATQKGLGTAVKEIQLSVRLLRSYHARAQGKATSLVT